MTSVLRECKTARPEAPSTVDLAGDHGTGETYCMAHHLTIKDGQRTFVMASLRYLDKFVKQDCAWLFAERKLLVDWTDTPPSTTQSTPARA
jgi:hypothetical protein